MPDINFLDDNQNDRDGIKENKPKSKPGSEVVWTEPDDSLTNKGVDAPDYKSYSVRENKELKKRKSDKSAKNRQAAEGKRENLDVRNNRKKTGFFGLFGKLKSNKTNGYVNNGADGGESSRSHAKSGLDGGARHRDASDKKAEKNSGESDNSGMPESGSMASAKKRGEGFAGRKLNLSHGQWVNPAILKMNLVSGENIHGFEWRKSIFILAVNIISAFLIIAVVYAGLMVWKKYARRQSEFLIEGSGAVMQKIISLEKDLDASEVDTFNDKLKLARFLLNKHIYWSNFFDLLERDTLKNVYYNGDFSGDTSGKYKLDAVTGNFKDIADQIKVMRLDEDIIDVSVARGELGGKAAGDSGELVGFNLGLKVKPELFTK